MPRQKWLYYLSSPYSHPDPITKEVRYQSCMVATAALMTQGYHVFSPILHNHPVQIVGGPVSGWGKDSFWQHFDLDMLRRCDGLMVLTLDGWDKSVGVMDEMEVAKRVHHVSPRLIDPTDILSVSAPMYV